MEKLKINGNSLYDEAKNRIISYHKNVNWLVFLFILSFTIGSWIDINGMWCELPIMVHELPEGWKLASVLSILTQVSQIAPVSFLILKWKFPKHVSFVFTIYIILGIGALSCLLLSFFWNKTAIIGNEERSIGLYILTFTLGLLDGTSSVTFLPYIGTNFKKEYIIPNFIGESFSAMIPSIVGIIQGVGQDLGCRNVTKNQTNGSIIFELEPIPSIPNFSVSSYYLFLFILLCISVTSFSLLNFLPLSKKAHKNIITEISAQSNGNQNLNSSKNKILANEVSSNSSINSNKINNINKASRFEKIFLFIITFFVSLIGFGVLPGIQTYSTLPYGNNIFHLAINLSYVCLPFVIFFSIWSYKVSSKRIFIEFLIGLAFAIYIIVIGSLSPCPPLLENKFGSFMIIIAWIVTQNSFIRVRCCIAARLEECGQTVLLIIGGCTMIGSLIGGIISFLCINTYQLFKDIPYCTTALNYCLAQGK